MRFNSLQVRYYIESLSTGQDKFVAGFNSLQVRYYLGRFMIVQQMHMNGFNSLQVRYYNSIFAVFQHCLLFFSSNLIKSLSTSLFIIANFLEKSSFFQKFISIFHTFYGFLLSFQQIKMPFFPVFSRLLKQTDFFEQISSG